MLSDKQLFEIRSAGTLLQHLEGCSHHERQRELSLVGTHAAKPSGEHILAVLCGMATSDDHYQRLMSITSLKSYIAHFNGETLPMEVPQAVESLLRDSSPLIYSRTASAAGKVFRSWDAVRLVGSLPVPQIKVLCKAMLKEKKQTLLDECFKQEAVVSNAQRRNVVGAFVSESLAESWNDEVFLGLSTRTFRALTMRFPEMMLRKAHLLLKSELEEERSAEGGPLAVSLQPLIRALIRTLYITPCAHAGLQLVKQTLHRLSLPDGEMRRYLAPYMALYTQEACTYVLDHAELNSNYPAYPRRLRKRIYKLPVDLQVQLLEADFFQKGHFDEFGCALREKCLKEHRELLLDRTGYVALNQLDILYPAACREAEALKIFNDKKMNDGDRIEALKVMKLSDIQSIAKDFIENPDVDLRMRVLNSVVKGTRFYPEQLKDVMEFVLRRKNEQDPYRSSMFDLLGNLKVSIWDTEHLPILEQLIKTMLGAKDLSMSSAFNAANLLMKVSWKHPEFAANKLMTILKWNHSALPRRLSVPVESAKVLLKHLTPLIMEWIDNKNFQGASVAMQIFKPVLMKKMSLDLEPLLRKCMQSKHAQIAKSGMKTFVELLRVKALTLLPELLKKEPDWIFCDAVQKMVSVDLQGTLLTLYVSPLKHIEGKLVPKEQEGDVHYVTFPNSHLYRWTSKQQRTYAKTMLSMIAGRARRNHWMDQKIFKVIGSLPSVTLDDGLLEMMPVNYEPAYLHALAMGVLGDMNDKASLKELCVAISEEGEGSRAREAARPLVTRLRKLSFEGAAPMLEPILNAKSITVQKEAVMLLGSFGTEGAFARLRKFEEEKGDNLHKDVRVALLQAYWSFLWKREVWSMYETVSKGDRAAAIINIMSIPADLLTTSWQNERFNHLVLTLLRHSERSVVMAALGRLRKPQKVEDPRWYPSIYRLMDRVVEDEAVAATACDVILSLRVKADELTQSVSLLSSDAALNLFVERLQGTVFYHTCQPAPPSTQVAYALAQKLIDARRQPTLAARCVMMCFPHVWVELLEKMQKDGLLHPGVQFTVLKLLESESFGWSAPFREALAQTEKERLRHHENVFFRRLGLGSLTCPVVDQWTSEARGALKVYQVDEERWIRDDAKLVVSPKET